MKKLSIIIFIIGITTDLFAQSDTNKIDVKTHKNNIQTNLLGFAGYFGCQYERALSKDISISLLADYFRPFAQFSPNRVTYKQTYFIQTQLRYYLDKNSIFNDGFYFSGNIGYKYSIDKNVHTSETYIKTRAPFGGLGMGYQFLIKNRLVLDAGFETSFTFKDQINNLSNNKGWVYSNARTLYIPIYVNIGYAF